MGWSKIKQITIESLLLVMGVFLLGHLAQGLIHASNEGTLHCQYHRPTNIYVGHMPRGTTPQIETPNN